MVVVGAAMVIDAALFSVMAPLLPHYKHALGLSKAEVGVLAGSFGLGTVLASLPAAALAMRISVKLTIVVGLALSAVSTVAVGLADNVWQLDVARFAQGAAGGVIWSAGLAWVSSLAPPDRRGAVLGTLTGTATAGSLLGPPVGALAVATSPKLVFSAIPVLNLILFMFVVRLPSAPVAPSTPPWTLLSSPSRAPAAVALWLIFAPAMALGLLGILGPLTLNHLGGGAGVVAATFVFAAIGESTVNPLAGHRFDRHGLRAVTVIALPIEAAFLMLFVVADQVAVVAVIVMLAVAITGAFWAPAAVILSASTTRTGISDVYAFALFNIAWAAGQSVGASGGGSLAQITSNAIPCVALGFVLLATIAVVYRVHELPQSLPGLA